MMSRRPDESNQTHRAGTTTGACRDARESSGAEHAWGRILDACRADLTRFAVCLTRDHTVAEDIVQETMLRAWRARGGLREPTAIRAWLFTIARREHARLHERKQPPLVCIDVCSARHDNGLALYDEDPQINELLQALWRLSDVYRVPLVMQVLWGFTTAEIATELGITVTAVLTRLFRARNQLREAAHDDLSRESRAVEAERVATVLTCRKPVTR